MRFRAIQPDNPILRREILHQKRDTPLCLQRFEQTGIVLAVLAIAPYLIVTPLTQQNIYWTTSAIAPKGQTLQTVQMLFWIIYIPTIVRSIMAGTEAMSRDVTLLNWDSMMLTGLTSSQIVFGKWWAAVHHVRGWFLALGIARLIIAATIMADYTAFHYTFNLSRIGGCHSYNSMQDCIQDTLAKGLDSPWKSWEILAIPVIAVILTSLEIVCNTAIGMMTGILIRPKGLAVGVGVLLRTIPILVFTLFPDYPNAAGFLLWRWSEYTWFALVDGGTTGIMRFASPSFGPASRGLLAVLAAVIMLSCYLGISLVITMIVLRRRGALPNS